MKKKKIRRRSLLTLATMTACAVASQLDALASTTPNAAGGSAPAPVQMPVRRFHIVAGSLDTALDAYRQQSGIAVNVSVPADQLAAFHTTGLQGLYTTDAALRELLKGTGLSCTFENASNAIVGLQHSDSVDVTAQLPD